jgi:methyl-accepting chemotaxis protein
MRLTIRLKLLGGFTLVAVLVALVGLLGWRATGNSGEELERLYESNVKAAVSLANAQDALWRLRYGFPQFLVLTKAEDRARITDEEPRLTAIIQDSVKAYAAGDRTPEEREALREWVDISEKYFAARPKWFELIAAGRMQEAADWRAATTTPFGAGSVKALGNLIELQRKSAERRKQASVAAVHRSAQVLVVFTAVAFASAVLLAVVIARGITGALRRMTGGLAGVATGDLTVRLETASKDELGDLAHAFNASLTALHDIVRPFSDASGQVASAAHQLSGVSSALSSGAQEQASSLEETAASVEEITGTVRQNADNARQADQLAAGARSAADQGRQVVSEAVAAMAEINRSSRKIADIITTIDEIAFQTNLLALNAAVEAARAGEQGRGFAVVAAEVRNLAQRSATAAKEIKGLIKDSVGTVEAGSELVNKSGVTLQGIVAAVTRVTDVIGEIAAASKEQLAGIEQVNRAVTQMDQVVQANAVQTEEMSSTAQVLAEQAAQLRTLVGRFRIAEGPTAAAPAPVTRAAPRAARRPSPPPPTRAAKTAPPTPVGAHPINGHHDEFEEF